MKASILAGAFIAALSLVAAPVHAQRVSAEVVVRGGPVAGHVIVGEEYSTYRRSYPVGPSVRRVVVLQHYAPRVIVVEQFHRHQGKHWKRHGYRPITVYYADGRYYDRFDPYYPGLREVRVYQGGGRYYRDCDDDRGYRPEWDDEGERDD